MGIRIKRVYSPASPEDGYRILVDRLWPRGVTKEKLTPDEWNKAVAPSNELRKSYAHQPEHWEEFKKRYFAELDDNKAAWQPILKKAENNTVTLLFAARDEARNNAAALKEYLELADKRRRK